MPDLSLQPARLIRAPGAVPGIARVSVGKADASVPGRSREQRLRALRLANENTVGESAAEEGARVGEDRTGADPRPAARVRADGESARRPLGATEDRLGQRPAGSSPTAASLTRRRSA